MEIKNTTSLTLPSAWAELYFDVVYFVVSSVERRKHYNTLSSDRLLLHNTIPDFIRKS